MKNFTVQAADPSDIDGYFRPLTRTSNGKKQVAYNPNNNKAIVINSDGLKVNSALRKNEWEELDSTVYQAARLQQGMLDDIRAKGLVRPVPFEAVISQWNTSSEVTAADESITGEAKGNSAAVDFNLEGVAVPVLFKEFTIPRRLLLASRRSGQGLDTTTAFEAATAVAELRETMIVDGSSTRIGANVAYGYTNHPDLLTDTAANYGGGDWGTPANIIPTIQGMLNAVMAASNRFRGAFMCYIARTQYNQAALEFPSTDNNSTYVDRIRSIDAIEDVKSSDFLADGEVLLVQLTQNVVDYVEASDIQLVEWQSGDGMTSHFKVMAVGAPRVKSDHANRIGVILTTGA